MLIEYFDLKILEHLLMMKPALLKKSHLIHSAISDSACSLPSRWMDKGARRGLLSVRELQNPRHSQPLLPPSPGSPVTIEVG